MPGSSSNSFTEAGDYHAALADVFAEFTVALPGVFSASAVRTTLPHVQLLCARETLSRVAYISLPRNLVFISFSLDPALPLCWRGLALEAGEIMLHRRGERLHQRTNGPSRWQLIALSPAALATFCKTEAGYEQTLPSLGQVLRPPPSDLRRLLRLCGEAARLAETRPEVLRHPAILRAMECELAGILARCLLDGEERAESPGMRRAADVMTRLEGVLAAHSPRTLPAVELCQVLGVSEHTLRLYCASFLGFGARRYIQLRRLRLVRAALLGANPQKAQITELATRGGFSKRSRFTRLYKAIYCETPAETLRRAGDA